jgi:hypothetical protein
LQSRSVSLLKLASPILFSAELLFLLHTSFLSLAPTFPLSFFSFCLLFFDYLSVSLPLRDSTESWLSRCQQLYVLCLVNDTSCLGCTFISHGVQIHSFLQVRSWHDPESCDISHHMSLVIFLLLFCLPSLRLYLTVSCGSREEVFLWTLLQGEWLSVGCPNPLLSFFTVTDFSYTSQKVVPICFSVISLLGLAPCNFQRSRRKIVVAQQVDKGTRVTFLNTETDNKCRYVRRVAVYNGEYRWVHRWTSYVRCSDNTGILLLCHGHVRLSVMHSRRQLKINSLSGKYKEEWNINTTGMQDAYSKETTLIMVLVHWIEIT